MRDAEYWIKAINEAEEHEEVFQYQVQWPNGGRGWYDRAVLSLTRLTP
jgi:hypothetical protein